jgi:hypothetical protein
MNSLEMRVRSWELRAPSASLKPRLFPGRPRPGAFAWSLRWLAPALTCALLGALIVNQESSLSSGGAGPESLPSTVWSNHTTSAIASNDIERAGSNVPSRSFELTNHSDSTSGSSAWIPVKLN